MLRDLAFVLSTIVAIVLLVAYVKACDRLSTFLLTGICCALLIYLAYAMLRAERF